MKWHRVAQENARRRAKESEPPPVGRKLVSREFTVKYRGTCTACKEPIEKGDRAVFQEDKLRHARCSLWGEGAPT
jgi:hypothetical protein